MTLTHGLVLGGAVNFALLGAAGAIEVRRNANAAWAALFFGTLAAGVLGVSAAHQTEGPTEQIAWRAASILFLAGPALYGATRSWFGPPLSRKAAIAHLIAGAAGAAFFGIQNGAYLLLAQLAFYLTISIKIRLANRGDRKTGLLDAMAGTVAVMIGAEAARQFNPAGVSCNIALIAATGGAAVTVLLLLINGRTRFGIREAYAKAGLTTVQAEAIWVRMLNVLRCDELHRRSDLKLGDWASAAGVTRQQASQALSQIGGTSFADFITDARVEDAKRRLAAPRNRSVAVEPIGMEAGFRSRSAFYASFKKRTGITPAEYRIRSGQNLS